MKLIGIMSIGSFYSPWFPYTVASIYRACDEIVVSNVGYDMKNPKPDELVPLQKVSDEIKKLDMSHKITELKNISVSQLYTRLQLMTQKEANKTKNNSWFDVRGVGLTAANEQAVRNGANWILKIDTDQAAYNDVLKLKTFLHLFPSNGVKFRQYEFCGDVGGKDLFETYPLPSPYEDSIFVYKALSGQFYGGGGSPALYLPGEDRLNTDVFHSAHLRNANPIWLTEKEKYDHFYGRAWFRNYTNKYGKFCPELDATAKEDAYGALAAENKRPTDIIAPEVCYYKNPVDYIYGKF